MRKGVLVQWRKIRGMALLIFVVFNLGVFNFSGSVHAANVANHSNPTVLKAYFTALRACYSGGAMSSPLRDDATTINRLYLNVGTSSSVTLPTGSTNDLNSVVNCRQLIFGSAISNAGVGLGWDGLFDLFKSGDTNVDSRIAGLGYVKTTVDAEDADYNACVKFRYKHTSEGITTTTKDVDSDLICATVDGSGIVTSLGIETEAYSATSNGEFPLVLSVERKKINGVKKDVVQVKGKYSLGASGKYWTEYGVGDSWTNLKNDILAILANKYSRISSSGEGYSITYSWEDRQLFSPEADESGQVGSTQYVIDNVSTAADTAVQYFSNAKYKGLNTLLVGDAELYAYYMNLLKDYFFSDRSSDDYWKCDADWNVYPAYTEAIAVSPSGVRGDCKISTSLAKSGTVNGFKYNSYYKEYEFDTAQVGTKLNVSALIAKINELAGGLTDEELLVGAEESENSNIGTEPSSGASEDQCKNSSGALGWFLCPVLNKVAEALGGLYSDAVKPLLTVNSGLFDSDSGTRQAWDIMIGFANTLVAIFLLVVIFSQVTGVGIDNYGIKKSLPKIILVAVLVNLSYLICQLAVDLSNILGNSLESLMTSIDVGVGKSGLDSIADDNIAWFKAMFNAVSGGMVVIEGVSVVAAVASTGWLAGLIIPLLLFFVSALVAVLTFFILMGLRQAGVVLLIVLAPLAMVCYMLPNTKKWFDKWLKLFEALLLLFPMCGLMVGGGQLVSKILLSSSTDYIMYFIGCVAMVAPFFFIPSLLKSSMAGLGSIGTKVAGFGKTLGNRSRGKLEGTVKNDERFKNRVQYNKDMQAVRQAQRTQNRLNRISGGDVNNLSQSQRDRLHKANTTLLAYENRKNRAAIGADQNLGYAVGLAHQEAAFANEREKSYGEIFSRNDRKVNETELQSALLGTDAEKASAALTTLISQGGVDEALRSLEGADWTNMDAGVERRLMQTMAGLNVDAMKSYAKYRQTGGKAGFQDWANGTGAVIASEAGNANIKDKTFAQHLKENGVHAMDAYSKDEMQFVNRYKGGIRNELGDATYGAMLGSSVVNSKDAKAQTITETILSSELSNNNIQITDLGLTSEMISNMRDETAGSIVQGAYMGNRRKGMSAVAAKNQVGVDVSQQVSGIKSDARLLNRTRGGVRKWFGI